MNTTTEAKQEISQEPMAPQASGTDSSVQPARGHGGGLWILTVALVAFAGLAAALAIGAFDGSNGSNADVPAHVAPRLHPEFHHPGQLVTEAPVLEELDYNTYRVPPQPSPSVAREASQAASQEEVAPYGADLKHEAR
jgi:hypothetical protein